MRFFITGGSRGLGKAMVLAAVEAGHDVAFTFASDEAAARATQKEASRSSSIKCQSYRLDVRDPEQVDEVAQQVLDDFGQVDVVVPNAGIARNGLAATLSNEAWQDVIDVNLSGAFYVVRAFLPTLVAQRFGRLIFVSSLAKEGMEGQASYSTSKAGLIGLTKTLGKEYGPKGITANVLVPGYFDTDMTRSTISEEYRTRILSFCPAHRAGEGTEIGAAVLFLASPAASFINCAVIPITGGLTSPP